MGERLMDPMININNIKSFVIALISIFLGATGQFLLRVGMLSYGKVTAEGIWKQLFSILFTPAIFLGFMCFGISSILWLVIISRWELSFAYPMVALGYVLVLFYGSLFLHEVLTWPKIIGTAFILLGIVVLGLFNHS